LYSVKHHVIYVPGILDDIYRAQSTALRFWWLWGVQAHLHAMPWAGQEAYRSKFERLLAEIDGHLEKGHVVSLIGASAGASAVLNAYDQRKDKINAVVYICGKINRPEAVSQRTYRANPAFQTALVQLQGVLQRLDSTDKSKLQSLYSAIDVSVPYADTRIPGVKERKLPSFRHGWAIIYAVTIGARGIVVYLKTGGTP